MMLSTKQISVNPIVRSSSTSSSSLSSSSSTASSINKDTVKTNKKVRVDQSPIDNNNDSVGISKNGIIMSKYEFTKYMTNWLRTNFYYPYPDHDMIIQMSKLCNRSQTTILNWLSNNRSRKWYTIMENVYAMDRNANTFYEDCMNVFDGKPVRSLLTTDNNDNESKEEAVVVVLEEGTVNHNIDSIPFDPATIPSSVSTKETTTVSDPTIQEEEDDDDDNVSTTTLSLDELMMIYNVIDDNDDSLSFKSERIFDYCCGNDDDNIESKNENDGNGNDDDDKTINNNEHDNRNHENNHGQMKIVSPTSTMSYDYNIKSDTLDDKNNKLMTKSSNDSYVRSFFDLDDGDDLYYNDKDDNLSITSSSSSVTNIHMTPLHDDDDDYYVMDDVDDHHHRLSTSSKNLRPWKRQKLSYDL